MNKNNKNHDLQIDEAKKEIESQIVSCYNQSAEYSGHLSVILRQLAFAEGALFWFSKLNFKASDILLILGLSALIVFFILDAAQYLVGLTQYENLAKKFHHDYKINKLYDPNKYDMNPPEYIDSFFYLKIFVILIASIILIYSFISGYVCSSSHF